VLILYSALSIPLALAMNGGRGPVVGMCGLFASYFNGLWTFGSMDGWMDGISRSVASSSSLACVCGAGLSVATDWLAEWLSSECATLTSGYSMRMAGWPNRNDNRLDGRG
jgi:hypothetical protein